MADIYDLIDRVKLRLGISSGDRSDDDLIEELLNSAESAILARRFPFGYDEETTVLPVAFDDLKVRIAIDLFNKIGAEGQLSHSENGVQRTYESSWISESLLQEVTPRVGVSG